MHDGEPHATQVGVGPFRQPRPQLGSVVVTPARDESVGPCLQSIEERRIHPVAGMHDDVGAGHLVPQPLREVARPLRDVGVGYQQQPHGQASCSSSAIFGMIACSPLSGRIITLTETICSSSFQWIMSMPLTYLPSTVAANSRIAERSLYHCST